MRKDPARDNGSAGGSKLIYKTHDSVKPPRWGVVTTCREPTQLIVAFAAHYIGLGASTVHIYLDAPQPDLGKLLHAVPQAHVTLCDEAYWQDHIGRKRPARIQFRQILNAFDAYHSTDVDWLAHFDVDEFLHADVSISDLLAAQPKELDFAVVNVRERVFIAEEPQQLLFDGLFRRPLSTEWKEVDILFNKGQRFLRQGVLGYPHGKSIMRTGRNLVPGIHTPRRLKEDRAIPLRGWPIHRARLLHFDGLTSLHWSAKLLRAALAGDQNYKTRRGRVPDQQRVHQIKRMKKHQENPKKAFDMHQHLKTIPQADLDRLRILGVLEEYSISPARDIAALGLAESIDLSRAAFDLALTEQQPQVFGWYAPWQEILAAKPSAPNTPEPEDTSA